MTYFDQTHTPATANTVQWACDDPSDPLIGSGAASAERLTGDGGAAIFTALLIWIAYRSGVPIGSGWQSLPLYQDGPEPCRSARALHPLPFPKPRAI